MNFTDWLKSLSQEDRTRFIQQYGRDPKKWQDEWRKSRGLTPQPQTIFKSDVIGKGTPYETPRYSAPALYLTDASGAVQKNEKGKPILNQVYNTSKFQDAMAGVAIGNQVAGQSQDQFFRLGAIAGGAIAGLFSGDLAGYQMHLQAQKMAEEDNKEAMAQTQAQATIAGLQQKEEMGKHKLRMADLTYRVNSFRFDVKRTEQEDKSFMDSFKLLDVDVGNLLNPNSGYSSYFSADAISGITESYRKGILDYYSLTGRERPDLSSLGLGELRVFAHQNLIDVSVKPVSRGGIWQSTNFAGLPVAMLDEKGGVAVDYNQIPKIREQRDAWLKTQFEKFEDDLPPDQRGTLWNEALTLLNNTRIDSPFAPLRALSYNKNGQLTPYGVRLVTELYTGLVREKFRDKFKDEEQAFETGLATQNGGYFAIQPSQLAAGMRSANQPPSATQPPQSGTTPPVKSNAPEESEENQTAQALVNVVTQTTGQQFWVNNNLYTPQLKTELVNSYFSFNPFGSTGRASLSNSLTAVETDIDTTQANLDTEKNTKKPDKTKISQLTSRLGALQRVKNNLLILESKLYNDTAPDPENVSQTIEFVNTLRYRIRSNINPAPNKVLLGKTLQSLYSKSNGGPPMQNLDWDPYMSNGIILWSLPKGGLPEVEPEIDKVLKDYSSDSRIVPQKNGQETNLSLDQIFNNSGKYKGMFVIVTRQNDGSLTYRIIGRSTRQ